MGLTLTIEPMGLTICRLPAAGAVPDWIPSTGFLSMTRTEDELSIVCESGVDIPASVTRSADWRALRVAGPLDLSLTGIMADLSGCLARASVPLFAISTYDTDLILVKQCNLERAVDALRQVGHRVN